MEDSYGISITFPVPERKSLVNMRVPHPMHEISPYNKWEIPGGLLSPRRPREFRPVVAG